MLVLTRKDGQWTILKNKKNGEEVGVRVHIIKKQGKVTAIRLAINDNAWNYDVSRPEAGQKKERDN